MPRSTRLPTTLQGLSSCACAVTSACSTFTTNGLKNCSHTRTLHSTQPWAVRGVVTCKEPLWLIHASDAPALGIPCSGGVLWCLQLQYVGQVEELMILTASCATYVNQSTSLVGSRGLKYYFYLPAPSSTQFPEQPRSRRPVSEQESTHYGFGPQLFHSERWPEIKGEPYHVCLSGIRVPFPLLIPSCIQCHLHHSCQPIRVWLIGKGQ